ncbi:MAG: cytochrome b/b6 domain-containing protein [Methylocystis sp.]
MRPSPKDKIIHPLFVRITHWINAFAAIAMLMSGWRIYNASPVFAEVRFPPEMTLGGWLAGALAWHFAVMWLLVLNGLAYLAYGIFSGHFWRDLISFSPMSAYRNLRLELKIVVLHGTGEYNIIQRVLYICVIWIVIALVVSGMAIWKPVQFQILTAFLGGYEPARRVHFFAMLGLVAFLAIHVGASLAIKGTMQSMFTGRLPKSGREAGKKR